VVEKRAPFTRKGRQKHRVRVGFALSPKPWLTRARQDHEKRSSGQHQGVAARVGAEAPMRESHATAMPS